MAETLQANRESIDATLARLGTVSSDVAAFTAKLPGLGDRTDSLLAAIDPAKVSGSIDRIDAIAAAVDPAQVRATVDAAAAWPRAFRPIARASTRRWRGSAPCRATWRPSRRSCRAWARRPTACSPRSIRRRSRASIDRIDAIAAAVDPEQVRATVDARRAWPRAFRPIARASTRRWRGSARCRATWRRSRRSCRASARRPTALLAAIDPAKVSGSIDRIDAIAAAVDPEQVRATVDAAADVAATMQAHRESIDATLTTLGAVSTDVAAFTARLPGLGEKTESLLAAVDSQKVGRTIDNVSQFTATLAANTRRHRRHRRRRARRVGALRHARRPRRFAARPSSTAWPARGPAGILEDAKATLAAVRAAADTFNAQVTTVGGGRRRLQRQGASRLPESGIGGAADDLAGSTGSSPNLEQNPSGFLFGGRERAGIWRAAALGAEGKAWGNRTLRSPREAAARACAIAASLAARRRSPAAQPSCRKAPSAIFDLSAPGERRPARGSAAGPRAGAVRASRRSTPIASPRGPTPAEYAYLPGRGVERHAAEAPAGAAGARRCRTAAACAPPRVPGQGLLIDYQIVRRHPRLRADATRARSPSSPCKLMDDRNGRVVRTRVFRHVVPVALERATPTSCRPRRGHGRGVPRDHQLGVRR